VAVCPGVGVRPFFLYAARGWSAPSRGGRRARSLERWQATGDPGHDVLSVPRARGGCRGRDGPRPSRPVGMRLSLGGVVFVQWGLAHRKLEEVRSIRGGRDSLGQSKRADNFLYGDLPDRHPLPPLLWWANDAPKPPCGRGLAALGTEVVQGLRFCVQRHVAACISM